jgi:hypothetical protein
VAQLDLNRTFKELIARGHQSSYLPYRSSLPRKEEQNQERHRRNPGGNKNQRNLEAQNQQSKGCPLFGKKDRQTPRPAKTQAKLKQR